MEDLIQVVDYDTNWPIQFEQEKLQILHALGDDVLDIHHIGSTSVPGLAAKPIIDILVGLEELPPSVTQIASLETLGYLYQGELGIPGRHFFRKGMPRTHHLHLVKQGNQVWENQLIFRDFLRAHPEKAKQYDALKRKLAVQFRLDREGYVQAKAPLIEQLLSKARAWRQII
ncbi:GrpB family protein [Coleofasciculus sp. FACHB-1120]|uniref:GrpB family protein n=1 Tax=Coleofasciculus sp. FACHB-1120 TaxID=2692783 RepID=UPI001685203E|nr:GrpB family protein [Coleofasciculus sp. FACHB-1120]MBD2741993.1 GrpB family protein [Coleofasciculus sp. FACHB-1120]